MARSVNKILNALRIGVIPDATVQELIVGRVNEQKEIRAFIESISDGEGRVKFIKGQYGSGKTFLLKYLAEVALNQNFIIANVSINSGFGFSKFSGVYSNIMNHLMVKNGENEGTSFEIIFDRWVDNLRIQDDLTSATQNIFQVINTLNNYNSSFSNVLLVYIRAKINNDFELATIAASWIKGDKNMAYQLKRRLNVKGSIDNENALDIFRGFVRLIHLLGYKGLIVAFDEAEMIMQQRVDTRLKAYSNIRQLMDYAGAGELDYSGFIFAGTDDFFEHEEKGLKSYKAIYQRVGKTLNNKSQSLNNVRQPVITITTPTREDYMELSRRVLKLHEESFAYKLPIDIDNFVNITMLESIKLLSGEALTIRVYLKKFIELLDLAQDNPELPIFRAIKRQL